MQAGVVGTLCMLLVSSATVIVRAGGAIWLNPFATVYYCVYCMFAVM